MVVWAHCKTTSSARPRPPPFLLKLRLSNVSLFVCSRELFRGRATQERTRTCGTGADGNPGSTSQTRTRACRRTRTAVSTAAPANGPRRPPSCSRSARCRGRSDVLRNTRSTTTCRYRRMPPEPTVCGLPLCTTRPCPGT